MVVGESYLGLVCAIFDLVQWPSLCLVRAHLVPRHTATQLICFDGLRHYEAVTVGKRDRQTNIDKIDR
jgi:hypothetical protein